MNTPILVVNCGSSSIKFAIYDVAPGPVRSWSGRLERIGLDRGCAVLTPPGERAAQQVTEVDMPDHEAALDVLTTLLESVRGGFVPAAVGHRVAHGGPRCDCPMVVTDRLEAELRAVQSLAPLHLPHNLAGMAAVRALWPSATQVACFDTAFHRTLPRLARITGLPSSMLEVGVRRYGFHGLSYEYVVEAVREHEGEGAAGERMIVAHLGSGASMAAIRAGRSVETTMGFSPLSGLPMGTRPGDLDPGIVLHLLLEVGMQVRAVRRLLYEESGLLGISGSSPDVRALLDAEPADARAAEALGYFCYHVRRHVGALAAVLGGVDRLVFTGGIGAHSPEIRARACDGLAHLGIGLDRARNRAGARTISAESAPVAVQAFPTDEEAVIASHVVRTIVEHGEPALESSG